MARRRRNQEEHENHERWLVSYADFITLLFAFFVVMYSVSSVNEGKYRVLSETLNAVFQAPSSTDKPIQLGEPPRSILSMPDAPLVAQMPTPDDPAGAPASDAGSMPERFQRDGATERISDQIAISLQDYIDQELVEIHQRGSRIEIEMKERMLFSSGKARLTRNALAPLRALSKSLKRIPSHLQVEGHTDNVPITTASFPSNWELSAARAASVVHFLARQGIEPWRMAAVGLGEHRPIAENGDEKGRAANRRVTIVVLTGQRENQQQEIEHEVPWAEGPAVGTR